MMKRLLLYSITVVLLLLPVSSAYSFQSAQATPAIGEALSQPPGLGDVHPMFTGCYRIDAASINEAYEQRVVELVNQYRASNNLPPLKRVANLDYAARYHADDMATDNYFSHDTYDGNGGSTFVCDTWTRLKQFVPNYGWAGENIAAGYGTPDDVMNGWLNSPGHRDNIVNTHYTEIGVGYYTGGSYGKYWVQDFAERSGSGVYPLIINSEAAATISQQVSLYIYGEGVWNEMRLRNDSGTWTTWQTFKKSLSWTLPCTSGSHTVTVEMRKTGQTTAGASSSDSILLQNSAGGTVTIGNLPAAVTFVYGQSNQTLSMPSYIIQPKNTSSTQTFNWTVNKAGDSSWFNLSSVNGVSPNGSFTTAANRNDSSFGVLGDHTGTLTIHASSSDPQCPASDDAILPTHLVVVHTLYRIYVPTIRR